MGPGDWAALTGGQPASPRHGRPHSCRLFWLIIYGVFDERRVERDWAAAVRRASAMLSEINIVPLVDVVLVLLIIFMLTAQVMEFGLEINVPKTKRRERHGRRPAGGQHQEDAARCT